MTALGLVVPSITHKPTPNLWETWYTVRFRKILWLDHISLVACLTRVSDEPLKRPDILRIEFSSWFPVCEIGHGHAETATIYIYVLGRLWAAYPLCLSRVINIIT